jgi:hypothetical protein
MTAKIEFDQIVALDLARHLDSRIATVLHDYMDRCAEVGITYEDATVQALTILGHYFTIAANGVDATEQEVVATCRWHYSHLEKTG